MPEEYAEWWECSRVEYDADTEHVRSSQLKDFADDPVIYKARHIDGTMPDKNQSREMLVGSCLHALVLEGEVTWKTASPCRATKKNGETCGNSVSATGAALWDTDNEMFVCGTHRRGRNVVELTDTLTPGENDQVYKMAAAVENSEVAQHMLADRFHERAARDIDPETGVKRKILVDVVKPRPLMIGDVKTTGEFAMESIWRKIDKNKWMLSLAHYEDVIQHIAKVRGNTMPPMDWVFLIVESCPPYRVTDWPIDQDMAVTSRREYRELITEFGESQRTGVYRQRDMNKAPPQWWYYVHEYSDEGSK